MGTPHRVCRTFARLDFILVPLPAARTTAKIGELSDIYPHHSYRSCIRRLGRQDSNLRSRDQNPVPCHLATPQYRPAKIIPERLFAVRKRADVEAARASGSSSTKTSDVRPSRCIVRAGSVWDRRFAARSRAGSMLAVANSSDLDPA